MNCLTTKAPQPLLDGCHGPDITVADNQRMAAYAMTKETEATASEPVPPPRRRLPDLLGVAYLATTGIVMTAWIGVLVWGAIAFVRWLTT